VLTSQLGWTQWKLILADARPAKARAAILIMVITVKRALFSQNGVVGDIILRGRVVLERVDSQRLEKSTRDKGVQKAGTSDGRGEEVK
jgi:hypothetical protein